SRRREVGVVFPYRNATAQDPDYQAKNELTLIFPDTNFPHGFRQPDGFPSRLIRRPPLGPDEVLAVVAGHDPHPVAQHGADERPPSGPAKSGPAAEGQRAAPIRVEAAEGRAAGSGAASIHRDSEGSG